MRLHRRTVDQDLRWRASCRCQNIEDILPNAFRRPSDEPIVEGLVRTIDIWCIDPAAAGLQHVHNAADDTPVIDPRLSSRIGRQKWCKPCKLIFR